MARAKAARQRAHEARQRADVYLQRGDEWLAQVEQSLARAQDLIVTNTELLIARLTRLETTYDSPSEGIEAARAAQRRALVYARIQRDRGQITRAQYHEVAAERFAIVVEILDDLESRAQPEYVHEGRRSGETSRDLNVPALVA